MKIWLKIRDRIKAAYRKVDSIVDCALLYIALSVLDGLTSLRFVPGMEESNNFTKHVDGSFWPWHAVITNTVITAEAVLASTGCYIAARRLDERWAKFFACTPWLYFAWLHLDAATLNVLYEIPGLYVRSARDILQRLLGN